MIKNYSVGLGMLQEKGKLRIAFRWNRMQHDVTNCKNRCIAASTADHELTFSSKLVSSAPMQAVRVRKTLSIVSSTMTVSSPFNNSSLLSNQLEKILQGRIFDNGIG